MQTLRRAGGNAGILAGVISAALIVVYFVVLPATGFERNIEKNPDKYLPYIAANRGVNLLDIAGIAVSLLFIVLFIALSVRLRDEAPARSRIGPVFGVIGATGFAIGRLISLYGFEDLATLYTTDKVAATHAFYALDGLSDVFFGLGSITFGLGILALGTAMAKASGYRRVGNLGVVAGALITLGAFVPWQFYIEGLGFILSIIWITWTGIVLRSEEAAT